MGQCKRTYVNKCPPLRCGVAPILTLCVLICAWLCLFSSKSAGELLEDTTFFTYRSDYYIAQSNVSLKLSEEIGLKEIVQQNYKELSEIYSRSGNPAEAFEYYKLHTALKDSVYNIEQQNKILELQTKYETEKKEKELEILSIANEIQKIQLSRNKLYILGLAVFILLIVFIGMLFIRQLRLKIKSWYWLR